jgi:hypothetical protein
MIVLAIGTPILPPSLDFFNVATVQEIPDEEQGSSLGECSRESTRNSRIASTSVGSSKLQRYTERSVTETTTVSIVLEQREGKVINQGLALRPVQTKKHVHNFQATHTILLCILKLRTSISEQNGQR